MSRNFWRKCARASAARKLNPAFHCHDRNPSKETRKRSRSSSPRHRHPKRASQDAKADLIREARRHEHEFTPTDNGGSRWSVTGNNGCIARVNFPAPALVSHIDSETELFDHVLGLAGESLDRLFASVYYLRPVAEFREERGGKGSKLTIDTDLVRSTG